MNPLSNGPKHVTVISLRVHVRSISHKRKLKGQILKQFYSSFFFIFIFYPVKLRGRNERKTKEKQLCSSLENRKLTLWLESHIKIIILKTSWNSQKHHFFCSSAQFRIFFTLATDVPQSPHNAKENKHPHGEVLLYRGLFYERNVKTPPSKEWYKQIKYAMVFPKAYGCINVAR